MVIVVLMMIIFVVVVFEYCEKKSDLMMCFQLNVCLVGSVMSVGFVFGDVLVVQDVFMVFLLFEEVECVVLFGIDGDVFVSYFEGQDCEMLIGVYVEFFDLQFCYEYLVFVGDERFGMFVLYLDLKFMCWEIVLMSMVMVVIVLFVVFVVMWFG